MHTDSWSYGTCLRRLDVQSFTLRIRDEYFPWSLQFTLHSFHVSFHLTLLSNFCFRLKKIKWPSHEWKPGCWRQSGRSYFWATPCPKEFTKCWWWWWQVWWQRWLMMMMKIIEIYDDGWFHFEVRLFLFARSYISACCCTMWQLGRCVLSPGQPC